MTVRAFAPGRVNLIGEHTDYNGGLSLPFATRQGVTVTATAAAGGIEAHALDLGETDAFALADPEPAVGWRAYVRGVVAELAAAGHALAPAHLTIAGTVPRGSGLSSSAALEVALALALLAHAGEEDPDRRALAQVCSRVEHRWVGAETGLLDQTASLFGAEGHALRIDFSTLELRHVPLELAGHALVTLDSGERHAHGDSGYNERRRECVQACERLGIEHLAQADPVAIAALPEPLGARARHVLTEDERVEATVAALRRTDLEDVGRLLDASHASLRDDYEVSTPAVERAIGRLREAGALGARLVGGGFGGHVLGLLAPGAEPPAGALRVEPGPGAHVN